DPPPRRPGPLSGQRVGQHPLVRGTEIGKEATEGTPRRGNRWREWLSKHEQATGLSPGPRRLPAVVRRCLQPGGRAGTAHRSGSGMGLAAVGMLNPLFAAFIHVSSELAFILNSARLLPGVSKRR